MSIVLALSSIKTDTCCGRIGSHPDEIWDESCFEFTVIE
jgi:hypothetical protein